MKRGEIRFTGSIKRGDLRFTTGSMKRGKLEEQRTKVYRINEERRTNV